jgi:hypothetical protein
MAILVKFAKIAADKQRLVFIKKQKTTLYLVARVPRKGNKKNIEKNRRVQIFFSSVALHVS